MNNNHNNIPASETSYSERIKSPEGVSSLMRELWERHQRGENSARGKVYFVDLPGPTKEEREQMDKNRAEKPNPHIPIDEAALKAAIE
ncbi:MAG: hypothetical protein NC453_25585, partial [Muribaculum sp.]|nr:hypothetical protein [Muribaculum sp.]